VSGNVMDAGIGFLTLWRGDGQSGSKELTDFLEAWQWKPGVNVLGASRPLVLYKGQPFPKEKPFRFPEDWKAFWKTDSIPGIVGQPRFQGGDPLSLEPDALTAAMFRLADGSPGKGAGAGGKDLGPDVDRIGPA